MNKILHLLGEGFKNIWRHKMTALTAILSLFIALYIVGVIATAGNNTHKVLHYLRSKYKIEVFFSQDVSNEKAVGFIHKIKKIEGVRTATIIEKEDAVRIFKDQFGEDIEELLGYNPLPVSAVVNVNRNQRNFFNVEPIIKSVVDDYNNIYKLKRGINISYQNDGNEDYFINGIENRIEQIIANLLDNAISFSEDNKDVLVKVSKLKDNNIQINILDEGQGFKEKDTNKIFKRFYSNRPDKFGQHSGLGLNIVKNLVELHNATIRASNRPDRKGASMEIIFPKA